MSQDVVFNDPIAEEVADAVEAAAATESEAAEEAKAEKSFTQAELDAIVQKRLDRQAAKYADYDTLKADADKFRQEQKDKLPREQQVQQELDELKQQLESERAEKARIQSEALRRDVAAAKGLSPKLASRLSGSTREELEADADDLLEAFPSRVSVSQKPIEELSGGGKPGDNGPKFDAKKVVENIPGF